MKTPLRIVHLEPSGEDGERIGTILANGGIACVIHRVETQQSFTTGITDDRTDLILAEFHTPGCGGDTAFTVAQKMASHVPFIFVSTSINESLITELLNRGVTDIISKDALGRLIPAVRRIVKEQQEREARREAEESLREHQLQLRHIQKLEAVGRLAGGLAHDFNNLLTVILGHSQVVLNEIDVAHPLRTQIQEMHNAGERARVLIRQLLMFSRKRPSEARVISLNTLLDDFESMLRRVIGEDIQLTVNLSQDDLRIKMDPALVEQIVMNLVVNARDAMPNGGRLTLELQLMHLDQAPRYHVMDLSPGEYVKLSVSDTGCGMSPEVQTHMFQPFFTTKDEEKGTGLGLSTVFDIVTQGGGGLDVTTMIGEGTRVDVYFPRSVGAIGPATGEPSAETSLGGHETVLLVEDDEAVRLLIRDELRKLGYRIVEARNGIEACLVATPYVGKLQLLLTDIVMPGMSGTELARHLRVIKPELKILFISGYEDDVGVGAGDTAIAYLQKPFTTETLAGTVRHLLDQTSRGQVRQGPAPGDLAQPQASVHHDA
ncbi:response regulator [Candidatus Nitrospira nitrosa]|nr:response regulator [Candidatus Nitrospira nitrosa]